MDSEKLRACGWMPTVATANLPSNWPLSPMLTPSADLMRPPLVLGYHSLGDCSAEHDPHNLMVKPKQFRDQILTLRRREYRFTPLLELVAQLDGGQQPKGVCSITFDDGTLDNLEVVAPLLADLGVPATFFVCPGLLGEPHPAFLPAAGVRMMREEELRELAASPFAQIGSHTVTHADLSGASAQQADHEMVSSKDALEALLQEPIESFAYPKCGYSDACPDAARRAGYAVAVTCGGRGGWRKFELAREGIDSLDGRLTFALKSRKLFWPLRESAFGRIARAAARPLRHG